MKKSVDGVLGTRTLGGSMVGADKSTELWRHPFPRRKYYYSRDCYSAPVIMTRVGRRRNKGQWWDLQQ